MLLGFKTELKLNNKQRTLLAKHCGVARHAWNWGLGLTKQILEHNRDNPEEKIKFTTAIDLHKKKQGAGMMANHKLAKAIADMGFYEFRRQLSYKCELYGSILVVVDQWYPSTKTCSRCHTKKDSMPLSERVFRCDNCGFECDLYLNASFNLEQAAS
ncbi:MAG: transposase [Hormoscilla sp. GUM202]|nr:transposase [Hormoscilla sp. GUM202]